MKKVFLKYLLHIICDKVALNVFQFCRDEELFSENDDREVGVEKSQDEETQLDEYHNPLDGVGAEKSQDEETQLDECRNPPGGVEAEKSQDEETQLDECHNPLDGVGAEKSQDEETQLDEYHNPEGPESPYWDPCWIQGIIITINVPLSRYFPLHTLFIFTCIEYGQAKAALGLWEYIAKSLVFAHTTPTDHSRDSILNVKQPSTS